MDDAQQNAVDEGEENRTNEREQNEWDELLRARYVLFQLLHNSEISLIQIVTLTLQGISL
jgi:hypothetical protein